LIRVLLVVGKNGAARDLAALLGGHGMEARLCATAAEALEAPPSDVVLADVELSDLSGVELVRRLKARDPVLPVLLVGGSGTIRDAVEAMRAGALDFLADPVLPEVIVERVRKAVERGRIERERDRLRSTDTIVARSPCMREALELVDQVAATDTTVLIVGESGTGKERVATFLHERSPRRNGSLVKVNCAAVPATLFEAEFFGHVKGAFTGADRERPGRFVEADGGTLFLDEIGTLSSEGQAKILRALETGEVRPVGATETRRVDVRFVAATNEPLEALRDGDRFRSDLYYRLAVFPILLPPLRGRPECLAELATRYASPLEVTDGAHRVLRRHDWPGNVRELRNVIERARLLAADSTLDAADLEPLLPAASDDLNLKVRVRAVEQELFREALRRAGGKKTEAAALLGIDPSNWAYHAKRLRLQ